ncbi:MAG: SpoIIE family protein phosphatase [Bacteroidales bacterium]
MINNPTKSGLMVVFLIFLMISLYSQSNKYGTSISLNRSEKAYSPVTRFHHIIQDNRGVMYAGTDHGLWEYDGYDWKYIKTPMNKGQRIMSLVSDGNGSVYIGMVGEFGRLVADQNGAVKYQSLTQFIDPGFDSAFNEIRNILDLGDKIAFCSQQYIFEFDHKASINVITLPEISLFTFNLDDNYGINSFSKGLLVHKNDAFVSLPGGEAFKKHEVTQMQRIRENEYLVSTFSKGIFRYNSKTGYRKYLNGFDDLSESTITDMEVLTEHLFAISTSNGVFITDSLGNVQNMVILNDNRVYSLFKNRQQPLSPLWIGTNRNISIMDHSLPILKLSNLFDANDFSRIRVFENNNETYIITGNSVFYSNPSINSGDYDLLTDTIQLASVSNMFQGGFYFLSEKNGLYRISRGILDSVSLRGFEETGNPEIYDMRIDPLTRQGFLMTEAGIITCSIDNTNWSVQDTMPNANTGRNHFLLLSDSLIFLENSETQTISVFNRSSRFTDSVIIENPVQKSYFHTPGNIILKLGDDIILSNGGKLFVYDSQNKIFIPSEIIQRTFNPAMHDISEVQIDSSGSIIFAFHEQYDKELPLPAPENQRKKWWVEVFHHHGDTYHRDTLVYKSLPDRRVQTDLVNDRLLVLQYPATGEIYTIDYSHDIDVNRITQNTALVRKVSITNDSVIFHGLFTDSIDHGFSRVLLQQSEKWIPILKYSLNDIRFTLSSDNYALIKSNLYRYRLIGLDSAWSDWSNDRIISFTNLRWGTYEFQAQTSNLFSQEGPVTKYRFVIQLPWYLKPWMYALYAVPLGLLLWLILKLNSMKMIRQKAKLEELAEERTGEIRNKTEEIRNQRDEIEAQRDILMEQKEKIDLQNAALTDSIKYARRIQDAVLPPTDVLRFLMPKHFVLYKPRDIVSGDFFWVDKQENQILLACGDCTGHGVPGAFMSMLGISLLTEITKKEEDLDTGEIMNELRERVIIALKQTGELEEAKDGMDLALISLNTKTLELQFTGAQLNLYLFHEGEFRELKGNRMPVGIHTKASKMFTTESFRLSRGDTIYLFSDGYPDQFGGEKGKKFGYKQFRKKLFEIQDLIMHDQKNELTSSFDNWKGDFEQVDDVLVIGIKV